VQVALDLLQKLFDEFPDPSQLSSAHLQAAQCYEQLGCIPQAIEHFQRSLDAQALYPNLDPGTALEYPWFVVMHDLKDHYRAALEILDKAHLAFPVQLFKAAAVRAFIAHSNRDGLATQHATEALAAAGLEQSQFRYHRNLGLVGERYASQIERLRAIAAA